MKMESPTNKEPRSKERSQNTGIILEGKYVSMDEITFEILKDAKDRGAITKDNFDRLHERYTRELELDALTGLSSRRLLKPKYNKLMEEMGRKEEHRSTPPLRSLLVIMIDLDYFKKINDTHGHETGDKALVAVATRIKESFHDTDTVVRMGGDELLVLVPIHSTSAVDYSALIKNKRAKITSGLALGLSMGYSVINKGDNISLEEAISLADQNMYKNKTEGK